MEMTPQRIEQTNRKHLGLMVWVVMLIVSVLPDALYLEMTGAVPGWLFWVKACFLAIVVVASLVRQKLRPALPYFLLLFVLILGLWGFSRVRGLPEFTAWEKSLGWSAAMLVFQGMKLAVTIVLVLVLIGLGFKSEDFYLRVGDPGALGLRFSGGSAQRGMAWKWLALLCGLALMPLTLVFFGGLPSGEKLARALPLLPFVVIGAALNAFNEEMQFRGAFLGTLNRLFGAGSAVLITSVFFGMAHLIGGSPSGLVGFFITGALGALFAKAMLETHGIAAGWWMHFCQNVIIYGFWAINAA